MRILHTSDLHLGQILYQYYSRVDEHDHFFNQLEKWIEVYEPDVLIVAGDIFDIAQPSASVWQHFTKRFVGLRLKREEMKIIIIAGNHDSATRLQANSGIWNFANTVIVGTPPPSDKEALMEVADRYIIKLDNGFIIALPFTAYDRLETLKSLQEYVAQQNSSNLPVVIVAHAALDGSDITGHKFDIGNLRTSALSSFGSGYDYLALGHIHRPQTLTFEPDMANDVWTEYDSPIARYAGSSLHVSCDERYLHSVSIVDIEKHGGKVRVLPLKIDQLRHFYILPSSGAYDSAKTALKELKQFIKNGKEGYIRFRFDSDVALPGDFNNQIYELLEADGNKIRYNPGIIWEDSKESESIGVTETDNEIELTTLQEMSDPLKFIEMTIDHYPELNLEEIREMFHEVEEEIRE